MCRVRLAALTIASLPLSTQGLAETPSPPTLPTTQEPHAPATTPSEYTQGRYRLVEDFTAFTLDPGEVKLGLTLGYGVSESLMLSTNLLSNAMGAPSLMIKTQVYADAEHVIALGVQGAFLNRQTVLWGSVADHFDELEARVVRPSVKWTMRVSPRLNLHTYWSVGVGRIHAVLSEKGRRSLWEAKHPDGDYETRNEQGQPTTRASNTEEGTEETDSSANQAKATSRASTFSQRTLQVQSIAGLAADIFQISGEIVRRGGNKIIVSCSMDRVLLEELRGNSFTFMVAQQWIWEMLQVRLGLGLQHLVVTGRDLDGENVDETGVAPTSEVDFYVRF